MNFFITENYINYFFPSDSCKAIYLIVNLREKFSPGLESEPGFSVLRAGDLTNWATERVKLESRVRNMVQARIFLLK